MDKKRICILLSILILVFFVFSVDKYLQLKEAMYHEQISSLTIADLITLKEKESEPFIINLSKEELAYHAFNVKKLVLQYGIELVNKAELIDISKNYFRMLYKMDAVLKSHTNSKEAPIEVIYYVYVFSNIDARTRELIPQDFNIVCVWGNGEAILNAGFKKDCEATNNWIYWKDELCPNVQEIELKIKESFFFEQLDIPKKGEKKIKLEKRASCPLFLFLYC